MLPGLGRARCPEAAIGCLEKGSFGMAASRRGSRQRGGYVTSPTKKSEARSSTKKKDPVWAQFSGLDRYINSSFFIQHSTANTHGSCLHVLLEQNWCSFEKLLHYSTTEHLRNSALFFGAVGGTVHCCTFAPPGPVKPTERYRHALLSLFTARAGQGRPGGGLVCITPQHKHAAAQT